MHVLHASVEPQTDSLVLESSAKFAFHIITATITLRSPNYDCNDHIKFQLTVQLIYTVCFYHQTLNSLLCVMITPKADASSRLFLVKQVRLPLHVILLGFLRKVLFILNEVNTQLLDRPLKQTLKLNPHRKMSFILSLT